MSTRNKMAAVGLAAVIALAPLAALPVAGVQAAPVQNPSQTAAAAKWLASQFVDGKYLTVVDLETGKPMPDAFATTEGLLGLIAADQTPEVVASATTWLSSNFQSYVCGSVPEPGSCVNPDAGRAAKLLIIADATHSDPTKFGGLNLTQIVTDGAGSIEQSPFAAGLALIALDRVKVNPSDAAVNALLDSQIPAGKDNAGAFGFSGYPDADSTGVAIQALQAIGGHQQQIDAAFKWLDTKKGQAEPFWKESYSPANTAGVALPAYVNAGRDVSAEYTWLASLQLASGAFSNSLTGTTDNVLATSQALIGLSGSSYATESVTAPDTQPRQPDQPQPVDPKTSNPGPQQPEPVDPETSNPDPQQPEPAPTPSTPESESQPTVDVTPNAEASKMTGRPLPKTGSSSDLPLALGALVSLGVAAGGALVLTAKRK